MPAVNIREIVGLGPLIPALLSNIEHAVPLAHALSAGGLA